MSLITIYHLQISVKKLHLLLGYFNMFLHLKLTYDLPHVLNFYGEVGPRATICHRCRLTGAFRSSSRRCFQSDRLLWAYPEKYDTGVRCCTDGMRLLFLAIATFSLTNTGRCSLTKVTITIKMRWRVIWGMVSSSLVTINSVDCSRFRSVTDSSVCTRIDFTVGESVCWRNDLYAKRPTEWLNKKMEWLSKIQSNYSD